MSEERGHNTAMDIQDPNTSTYVPLLGSFNFEHQGAFDFKHQHLDIANELSFLIDWTTAGPGQAILREHVRLKTPLSIQHQGNEYRGAGAKVVWGMNEKDSLVVVDLLR